MTSTAENYLKDINTTGYTGIIHEFNNSSVVMSDFNTGDYVLDDFNTSINNGTINTYDVMEAFNTNTTQTIDGINGNVTFVPGSQCLKKEYVMVLKACLCLFAIVGNSLIILSVWKFRKMRTIDNILICNLAVSSVFVCFQILTDFANVVFDVVDTTLKHICLAKTADTVLLLVSSTCNLLLMSVERYIAITNPLRFRSIVTYKRVKITLATCWIFYLILAIIPVAGLNTFEMPDAAKNKIDTPASCNIHNVLIVPYGYVLLAFLLVGTTANLLLFLRVICVMYRPYRNRKRNGRTRSSSSNKKTLTVILTLGSFIVCWIPFVYSAAIKSGSANVMDICIATFPHHFGIICSSLNWLIYGVMRPQFRRSFYAIFTCKPLRADSIKHNKDSFSHSASAMLRRPL